MLKRRRGVSTLIGVAFFLLIFMTGFAYYAMMLQARQRYDAVVHEMNEITRAPRCHRPPSPLSWG